MSEEIDHIYTSEIVCPWCGYEYSDSHEFHKDENGVECPECKKLFDLVIDYSVYYITSKSEGEEGKKDEL